MSAPKGRSLRRDNQRRRTTSMNLSLELLRELKHEAEARGVTLSEIAEDCLAYGLAGLRVDAAIDVGMSDVVPRT